MRPWLTSDAHPLRIDAVAAPGAPGLIGMTLCPGKKDPYAAYGAWDRNLQADLLAIRAWGAATIVSLLQDHEFELLGLPDFEAWVTQAFRWHWLPIPDGGVPDESFEEMWTVDGPDLRGRLAAGERVLIHCRAVGSVGAARRGFDVAPSFGIRRSNSLAVAANSGAVWCTRLSAFGAMTRRTRRIHSSLETIVAPCCSFRR